MTTTTSKSTTKKTGTRKKTSSKPNKPLETLLTNGVWEWHEWNFKGKENLSILNISDSNKDEDWLREQGYKNIKTISPNNIQDLEYERDYHIAILMYLKEMKDDEVRNDLMYEVGERLHPVGAQFIAISNKANIELDTNIVEENNTYTTYVC